MKVRNILGGLGLISALSPAVARADVWDDFKAEALKRGYGVIEVPLKESGVPEYNLWRVAEAVRGKDSDLRDGYDSNFRVTLCDSLSTRNEVVRINNRISDASAEVADAVGLKDYALLLRTDTELVRAEEVCSDVVVEAGRDGIRGDEFKFCSPIEDRDNILVAVKPEDLPSKTCVIPDAGVLEFEPVPDLTPGPLIGVPSLVFLPKGRNQWDLGYRRLGLIGGVYGRNFMVGHQSDELVLTEDRENGFYVQPSVTLPLIGSENQNWLMFGDYQGKFTWINPGNIEGTEQRHFIAGGLQYAGEKFGFGAELGGILYDRITTGRDGDVRTTTEQVGSGLGARMLLRAPGAVVGYNYDSIPLNLIVDGSIEDYGSFGANASANVSQHELFGGPLLKLGDIELLPYGSLGATNVLIGGEGSVPDQWNRQGRVGFGVDGRWNISNNWNLNLNGGVTLIDDIETSVRNQMIAGDGAYVGLGVTYKP